MAANQWKFNAKIEIQMPKVAGKTDTPKMKAAVNKALSKGAQKGATYVSKGLRGALDASITSYGAIDTGKLKNSLEIREKFSQTKVGIFDYLQDTLRRLRTLRWRDPISLRQSKCSLCNGCR